MKSKAKKVLRIIGIVFFGLIVLHLILTNIAQIILRSYIKQFDKVDYEQRLEPELGEEGFFVFRTDEDFKVMQLNDLHICGGYASIRRDKKAINQVMTMVQKEKPDLVILNGDSVFCVPAPIFNGGMTFNNKMTSKVVLEMFEQLEAYFSITFGNHDTEAFDFTNRENLGKLYKRDKYKYCIFDPSFEDYGVTNQCILIKNSKGQIVKTLILLDSNSYVDNKISSSINFRYDTIHDNQVLWAKETLTSLSEKSLSKKALFFFHIPVGEFVSAYRDLEANNFKDTKDTQFISGFWNEKIDAQMGERIWYGGCGQTEKDPKDVDIFFETLGPDGADLLDAVFVAHDHVNNATVKYKGVTLAYGNSIDNSAYTDIASFGKQRGSMVISIKPDGTFSVKHKNAYLDYGLDSTGINVNDYFYPDAVEK